MNLIVPVGNVKFKFTVDGCEYREFSIGDLNYKRITVPPGIWFSFEGLSKENYVVNVSNILHDPEESENIELNSFNL